MPTATWVGCKSVTAHRQISPFLTSVLQLGDSSANVTDEALSIQTITAAAGNVGGLSEIDKKVFFLAINR
jgi:hypothetical protein